MSRVAVEKILVSSGNHPVFAAGLPVYSCAGNNCASGKVVYNAAAQLNQFVWYNPATRLSVDPSVTAVGGPFKLGLFYDSDGDNVIDTIKLIAGEELGCELNQVKAQGPVCGHGEIHKTYVACINCGDKPRSTRITIDNNQSRNEFHEMGRGAEYVYTVPITCCDCGGDCDPTFNCREYLCELVSAMNGDSESTSSCTINGQIQPHNTSIKPHAEAFVINPTTYQFCVDASDGVCADCNNYNPIKGISIAGVVTNFAGLASATASSSKQIDALLKNINCTFPKQQGFAYREKGNIDAITGCCPIRISINTCSVIDGLVLFNDALLAPCATINEVLSSPNSTDCAACGALPIPDTIWPCGWGLVTYNATDECDDCYGLPQNPVSYWGSHAKIFNDEVPCGGQYTIKTQEAVLPQNMGVQLAWYEYNSHVGGTGRELHPTEIIRGRFPRSIDISRSRGNTVNCAKGYCTIALQYEANKVGPKPMGWERSNLYRTQLWIPTGDLVTKTAIIADINALAALGHCPAGIVVC